MKLKIQPALDTGKTPGKSPRKTSINSPLRKSISGMSPLRKSTVARSPRKSSFAGGLSPTKKQSKSFMNEDLQNFRKDVKKSITDKVTIQTSGIVKTEESKPYTFGFGSSLDNLQQNIRDISKQKYISNKINFEISFPKSTTSSSYFAKDNKGFDNRVADKGLNNKSSFASLMDRSNYGSQKNTYSNTNNYSSDSNINSTMNYLRSARSNLMDITKQIGEPKTISARKELVVETTKPQMSFLNKELIDWSPTKIGKKNYSIVDLLPIRKMVEFENALSSCNEENLKNMHKSYLRELVNLASTISRVVKGSSHYSGMS